MALKFISSSLTGLREDRKLSLLLIVFFIYVSLWSYFSISELLALNQNIFDLGVNMQRAWQIVNYSWPASTYVNYLFLYGISYFFIPIGVSGNYFVLLGIQSLFIGAVGFPLYGVSKQILKNETTSLLVALTCYLYFPLAGINWTGFHYQALFMFLFISGYYFYLKSKFYWSVILFLLSGTVMFPYMIFPFLFSTFLFAEYFIKKSQMENERKVVIKYSIVLMVSSLLFIVGGLYFTSLSGLASYHGNFVSIGTSLNPFLDFGNKSWTFVLYFAPLLFIPVLSLRWFPLTFPGLYVIFVGSNHSVYYSYPIIFQTQYGAGLIPFIFLGLIDGLSNLQNNPRFSKIISAVKKIRFVRLDGKKPSLVALILVVVILFAIPFQPYSPLNSKTTDNFAFYAKTNYNLTIYNEMMDTISLLPRDAYQTDILVQANLPEIFPRHYNISLPSIQPLIPGTAPFGDNITVTNALENQFPIRTNSGNWINLSIKYAIADPYSSFFFFGKPSMYDFLHLMLESGKYGILSEQSGIILLERGYNGTPKKFLPLEQVYTASELRCGSEIGYNSSFVDGRIIGRNFIGGAIWGGPDTYLPPGEFKVTFTLMTSNNSENNYVILEAQNSLSHTVLTSVWITGANFSHLNQWIDISVYLNSTNVQFPVQFNSWDTHWSGALSISSVRVKQISAV